MLRPASSGDNVASNEQDVNFAIASINAVEMSKAKYTQLQQVPYSQMDPQSNKIYVETKEGPNFHPVSSSSSVFQYHPVNETNQSGFPLTTSESQNFIPILCQSVLAPACGISTDQSFVHLDLQKMRMIILNETNSKASNEVPDETGLGCSGVGTVQLENDETTNGNNRENENLAQAKAQAFRFKCPVRVRLVDRFNRIQSKGSGSQQVQNSSNNPETLIYHPTQNMEAKHRNYAALVKVEDSADTRTLQFLYTCNSPSSSSGSSQTQVSDSYGCSSPLQEESKLQEMSLPSGFSFSYQQEWESTRPYSSSQNKLVSKQIWNEDAFVKKVINQRSQSPQGQLDEDMEWRLRKQREIHGSGEKQAIEADTAVSCPPTECSTGEPAPKKQTNVVCHSREKKNRVERDRRCKIRVCCDRLNALVPFCNAGTDRATTLQWTVSFLRYIQKQHGDSIKKEFESSCSKKQRENENSQIIH